VLVIFLSQASVFQKALLGRSSDADIASAYDELDSCVERFALVAARELANVRRGCARVCARVGERLCKLTNCSLIGTNKSD
jgi:hypothetical protein